MERRVECRRPARIPVGCHGPDGRIASRLRDISPSGCRLSASEADLEVGNRLTIELIDKISVEGIVRWLDAGEAGVEFTIRVHDAMLEMLAAAADRVFVIPSAKRLQLQDQFGRTLPRLGRGRSSRLPWTRS